MKSSPSSPPPTYPTPRAWHVRLTVEIQQTDSETVIPVNQHTEIPTEWETNRKTVETNINYEFRKSGNEQKKCGN